MVGQATGLDCSGSAIKEPALSESEKVMPWIAASRSQKRSGPAPNTDDKTGPLPTARNQYGAPLEVPLRRGFLVPPNGLRGSHCGAAAFAALSCGRDRVRWPCRWLYFDRAARR